MILIGKKVPERNIIGKVITFATTLSVSTLFATVPTSILREEKNMGPKIRVNYPKKVRALE